MPSNWNKSGFEVNKYHRDFISKNYNDITVFSEISQAGNNKYDLITMRGVIEYIFEFKELFRTINRSLKANGLVYICATPDFNSPCANIYKAFWNQIDAPLHYHQFTASSIAILFSSHNFGLKALYYPYVETPFSDFPNDANKFIKNVKRFLNCEELKDTIHAYPGTLMSLVFQKMENYL